MTELYLCRFRLEGGAPRLGLAAGGRFYDLSALGRPEYTGMAAWLGAAAGRMPAAVAELETTAAGRQPLGILGAGLTPPAGVSLLAPVDTQEVWACGVTYEMSRAARMRESNQPTIYGKVYDAPRPEIFFKATPGRVVGTGDAVAIRADSKWDVPEPEMVLIVTPALEIAGYAVGNDMSSRDIEGQNPLYLPQAKVYDRCCGLGPWVRLAPGFDPLALGVTLSITRGGQEVFAGETNTRTIHRPLAELVAYLGRCNSFPAGVFVFTGTGIVPPDTFTLAEGDVITIAIEGLGTLVNPVIELPVAE